MRDVRVSDWIASSLWANWKRQSMTGDASARHYERLSRGSDSVILMNAPPETCGSQTRFVQISEHLRHLGLAAPEVFAWDDALGLMVLEDLGAIDFARHLDSAPTQEARLYEQAVDALAVLGTATLPNGLTRMTPEVGAEMIDLAFEWAADDISTDLAAEITENLKGLLETVDPDPSCLSLRDYHAENLIWRPDQSALSQVGLLDFQDAFITHPAYDLASLLRDARRDVDTSMVDDLITRLNPNQADRALFQDAFHVMAIQRNLRIMGIFHRLTKRDGKHGYLALLPRVWGHLQKDLETPIARDLAPLIKRAFSVPIVTA